MMAAGEESSSSSFPEFLFPACHFGEEHVETVINKRNLKWGFNQRLNQVEYGNLSAFLFSEDGGGGGDNKIYYRNDVRDRIVHYLTSPLPLLPPNTTTPYEHILKSGKDSLTKQLVDNQYRYFRLKFPHTYVPVKTLATHIEDAVTSNFIHQEIEPCQGSVVAYVPSLIVDDKKQRGEGGGGGGGDMSMEGYLIFASGPNLNELTIAVLLNCNNAASGGSRESSYSSYYQYINEVGAVRLSCAETHRMPGRIRGIDALTVEEKILVAVRTDYYIAMIDGPSKSVEKRLRRKWKDTSVMSPSPVTLLRPVKMYQTPVFTSCVSICPYYYGECLFMIETGGLYILSLEEGIREIQSPLSEPFPFSHLWRCVWGPHPFSAVVLEHNCVSMVEFRNDQVIYTPLMDRDSRYLSSDWVTSAIAQHPIQHFYVFIATTDKVLLFDLRESHEPVLEIRHEISKQIHYLGVACFPWQPEETTLMMSSLQGPQCQVSNIKGGYSLNGEKVLPPRISLTLHTVDTYRTLYDELNLPFTLLSSRLTQSLAGVSLLPLSSSRAACAVLVSARGDLFYQSWVYGAPPPRRKPVVPYVPPEMRLWVEELVKMEKEAEAESGGVSRNDGLVKDFGLLQDYILSELPDNGLCINCVALFKEEGISIETESPPPPTNGVSVDWKCSFCLERIKLRAITDKTESLDENITGLEYLKRLAGISDESLDPKSLVSEYEELCDLWDKWDAVPDPENEPVGTGRETGGPGPSVKIKKEGEFNSESQSIQSQTRTNTPQSQPRKKKARFGF